MRPFEPMAGGVRLRVRLQPRASSTEIAGLHGDMVRIRVSAAPVDGAANEALLSFLAQKLAIPRRAVRLISGQTGRSKVVAISGLVPDELASRLGL